MSGCQTSLSLHGLQQQMLYVRARLSGVLNVDYHLCQKHQTIQNRELAARAKAEWFQQGTTMLN